MPRSIYGQGGRERNDTRRHTFREGHQLCAVAEVELFQGWQVSEPFGEWDVQHDGGTVVGSGVMKRKVVGDWVRKGYR